MKNIFKGFAVLISITSLFFACRKFDSLPFYNKGNAVQLSSSTNSIAPTPNDSLKAVIFFHGRVLTMQQTPTPINIYCS